MGGDTGERAGYELREGRPALALHEGRIDDFIQTGRIGRADLHIFVADGDQDGETTGDLGSLVEIMRRAIEAAGKAAPIRALGITATGEICACLGDGAASSPPADLAFLSVCLPTELDAPPYEELRARIREELGALSQPSRRCRVAVAPDVRRTLEFSVPDVGAETAQLPAAASPIPPHAFAPAYDGTGVIVACIDFGCDFVHPNFRRPDGGTRLIALWDQNDGSVGPVVDPTTPTPRPSPPVDFGRAFGAGVIDAALATDDPYFALGYDPHANYFRDTLEPGAHGTHVMDVAAGNGQARVVRPSPAGDTPLGYAPRPPVPKAPGVAPNADLLFVQVQEPRLADGRRVLSAGRVLDALAWVFRTADARAQPVVANISLGTNSGPHDGTALFDVALGLLLRKPGRAVVVAAGNAREEALHAHGAVPPGAARKLVWQIHPADRTRNDVEIWTDGSGDLAVTLTPPGAPPLPEVAPGEHRTIVRQGRHVGDVWGCRPRPHGGGRVIRISLQPFGNAGDWHLSLSHAAGPVSGSPESVVFDAWIERDDDGQSRFAPADASRAQTLATFACAEPVIVVGAYHGLLPQRDPASFSAEGPTRTGGQKPDVVAPGWDVFAAKSKGFQPLAPGSRWRTAARVAMTGTSVAAPHVTGIVALMLQKRPDATAEEIRVALRETADSAGRGWDPRRGCGRVSARDAIRRI